MTTTRLHPTPRRSNPPGRWALSSTYTRHPPIRANLSAHHPDADLPLNEQRSKGHFQ